MLGSSFGSSAGALRGGAKAADDSDDDETPGAGQRIGFEEGAISLDQVRRLSEPNVSIRRPSNYDLRSLC